ncbi:hypothetical protein REPUB_Repub20aG0002900 [Reevesia pubescens]
MAKQPNKKPEDKIGWKKKYQQKIRRLKTEMEEISKEQEIIKEAQRHKFQVIEAEVDLIRRETEIIMQKSIDTQLRLALMFRILNDAQARDRAQISSVGSNDPAQHSSVGSNDPGEARDRAQSSSVG